jgi:hypothetical protein
MRGLFPKKKSRLSPQGKVIAAAHALLDTMEGRLDEQAAGRRLLEEVSRKPQQLKLIPSNESRSGQGGRLRPLLPRSSA